MSKNNEQDASRPVTRLTTDFSNTSESNSLKRAALATMIQKVQIFSGYPLYPADQLPFHVSTWFDAVSEVPVVELAAAFKRATGEWDFSKGFQPDAITRAWRANVNDRLREAAGQASECRHCDGIGYQIVVKWQYGREYTSARGCVCAACPPNARSETPLTEPEWHRDHRGYFRHAPSRFARTPEDAA
jgi:hypothetical protein